MTRSLVFSAFVLGTIFGALVAIFTEPQYIQDGDAIVIPKCDTIYVHRTLYPR